MHRAHWITVSINYRNPVVVCPQPNQLKAISSTLLVTALPPLMHLGRSLLHATCLLCSSHSERHIQDIRVSLISLVWPAPVGHSAWTQTSQLSLPFFRRSLTTVFHPHHFSTNAINFMAFGLWNLPAAELIKPGRCVLICHRPHRIQGPGFVNHWLVVVYTESMLPTYLMRTKPPNWCEVPKGILSCVT